MKRIAIVIMLATFGYGCATSDGPPEYDPELLAALGVERELAPGTTKVKLFEHMPPSNSGDAMMDFVQVAAARDASGAWLVNAVLAMNIISTDNRSAQEGFFTLDDAGLVTRLERPGDAPPLDWNANDPGHALRARGIDGAVLVQCSASTSAFALDGGALVSVSVPAEACSGGAVLGASGEPGTLASVANTDGSLAFEARRSADGSPLRSASASVPADATPVFVEESAPGDFVAVLSSPAGLLLARSDGSSRSSTLVPAGTPVRAARVASGEVVMFLPGQSAVAWAIDDPVAEPVAVQAPPLEGALGAASWIQAGTPGAAYAFSAEPNARYDAARVPVAYGSSVYASGAFDATAVPTTPCSSRARCRNFGESYLVAVFDVAPRAGLFVHWSWSNQVAFFVSPLDRTEAP